MSTPGNVVLERQDGVARVIIDRPPLNVLDIATLQELDAVLGGIAADDTVATVVLTGRGRAFCAGLDVADHIGDRVGPMLDSFHSVIERLMSVQQPVIAAVNGPALGGGCELLLACDLVIARAGAKLGQPEIRLGVFPPAATAILPLRIGLPRALDLILTGRTMTAVEAHSIGLVSRVVPDDDFNDAVESMIRDLASLSAPVLRVAKRAARLEATGVMERLEAAELMYTGDLMKLDDAHEGLTAFLEKRPPVWKGA